MLLKVLLTLASPLALVTITELAGLVGAGGSTGGDDGAVETGLGDYIDPKVSQKVSKTDELDEDTDQGQPQR